MKTKLSCVLITVLLMAITQVGLAAKKTTSRTPHYFGAALCKTVGYECLKVKRGQSWKKLFPDEAQRDIVQRVNRTNMRLWAGRMIAVPTNLAKTTIQDVAPFPKQIEASDNKLIIVDQNKLAWGAYGRDGNLVKWGAISSGKNYCGDIKRACTTMTGEFYVFNKKDKRCKSSIFPVGRGGSVMPYCMYFYKGYALHGSNEVPGYRASHGCVRLFTRDAKWLNTKFVELPNREGTLIGTKVVVQKLTSMD